MEVIAAEFARMAGVSKAAISVKIKNKTLILNSGGKLDTDNPVNRAYLDKKNGERKSALELAEIQRNLSEKAGAERNKTERPEQKDGKNRTQNADEIGTMTGGKAGAMLGMTIQELIVQYGDIKGIADYAKILRDLTAADEREQKTQERRMIQIPKDFVVSRLFSFYDELMNKLLDVPESVADQVIALSLADKDTRRQDVINVLSDNITRCIAGAKERIVSELNGLKGKYDKQEDDSAQAIADLSDKLDAMKEG